MLNTYQDRGIIKWAAFDALNGFNSMLKEMRYRLGQIEKPTLSEDELEILDRNLKTAFTEHTEMAVTYFEDGYSKTTFGRIKKLDYNDHCVVLTTSERISAFDILNIDII
ncbi:MAG: YolD-like family protein [Bacilli bacterium]|nr:YolD-like family protein [Bacilli bacterium]